MAVMDRNMYSPLGMFFLIIFGIETMVSVLGNGFIILVNSLSWLHSRKTVPCDFLLTVLSLSRFLLQWVSLSYRFMYFSSPQPERKSCILLALTFSWMYLNVASIWCATGLNVFYCVKVANFAHPLFVWLKPRIGVLVPRFLGIALLAFIICSIPPLVKFFEDEKCHNLTGDLPENSSHSEAHGNDPFMFLDPLQICFTAMSFIICLTASILLLFSLWRHTGNLKSSLSTKDLSTQVHLSILKALLLLLFFYIVHFAAMIIALGRILKYGKLERLISDIFLCSYPAAHAVILIFTNPKLRKAYLHVLNFRRSTS